MNNRIGHIQLQQVLIRLNQAVRQELRLAREREKTVQVQGQTRRAELIRYGRDAGEDTPVSLEQWFQASYPRVKRAFLDLFREVDSTRLRGLYKRLFEHEKNVSVFTEIGLNKWVHRNYFSSLIDKTNQSLKRLKSMIGNHSQDSRLLAMQRNTVAGNLELILTSYYNPQQRNEFFSKNERTLHSLGLGSWASRFRQQHGIQE